jgi:prepilin-type processing-associated H-X9-DG protein
MYIDDNNGTYPVHSSFWNLGGNVGTNALSSSKQDTTPINERPLNVYCGNAVAVFDCPSDHGDSFVDNAPYINNCYECCGTSYMDARGKDYYGVAHVCTSSNGIPGATGPTGTGPAKDSTINSRPVTKILLGDWNWQPDRPVNTPNGKWHNYKGVRRLNMLYGDGHVGPVPTMGPVWENTPSSQAADMGYIWW